MNAPKPHHADSEPKLLLPRGLDPETVQVLAGVARELIERKARGQVQSALDAGYLDAHSSIAAMSYDRTPPKTYVCLLKLAAVAIEQANLIGDRAELSAQPMKGFSAPAPMTLRMIDGAPIAGLENFKTVERRQPDGRWLPIYYWPTAEAAALFIGFCLNGNDDTEAAAKTIKALQDLAA